MKGAHEAILWNPLEGGDVQCFLCSHKCRIKDGKRGFCRGRENRQGVLYSLVYGQLIAEHLDPIEKKPMYHFLPGSTSYSISTPGCNFRCGFCQNWQISQIAGSVESFATVGLSPEEVVRRALSAGASSISYTYTEPTIFMEFALDCARLAKAKGLKNVFVTNGYQTPEAVEAMKGLIDGANVDLKSFSDEFYRKYCKATLAPVLESIRNMHKAGILVEVTTLVLPGENDSADELRQTAEFLAGVSANIPWHVSRFHPDFQVLDKGPTPTAKILEAVEIGRKAGLNYVYAGNLPSREYSDTICPKCNKSVISRTGYNVTSIRLNADRSCGFCGYALDIVLD